MATQPGSIRIKGTLGAVTFYQREGNWLARKKTSLNKERVASDAAFERSRVAAKQFGKAAKLAKEIYWQLPVEKRGYGVIGKLTGLAISLLVQGNKRREIKEKLLEQFTGILQA